MFLFNINLFIVLDLIILFNNIYDEYATIPIDSTINTIHSIYSKNDFKSFAYIGIHDIFLNNPLTKSLSCMLQQIYN